MSRWMWRGALAPVMIAVATAAPVRAQPAPQEPARWSVKEIARIGDPPSFLDAVLWHGGPIVPGFQPPTLTAYDSLGVVSWSHRIEKRVTAGVAVTGDTIVVLRRANSDFAADYEIVKYLGGNGRAMGTRDVTLSAGQIPRLLGRGADLWIVDYISMFGTGMEARPQLELGILAVEPRSGNVRAGYHVVDTTQQAIPPLDYGRTPIRPPFGPRVAFAMLPGDEVAVSTGDKLALDVISAATGMKVRTIDLPPVERPTVNMHEEAAVWFRSLSENHRIRIDTLLDRLMAADTTLDAVRLGRVVAAPDGRLLVQRRDLMAHPLQTIDSLFFDVVDSRANADPVVTGRLALGPADLVMSFEADRVLCYRSLAGERSLIIYRISPP